MGQARDPGPDQEQGVRVVWIGKDGSRETESAKIKKGYKELASKKKAAPKKTAVKKKVPVKKKATAKKKADPKKKTAPKKKAGLPTETALDPKKATRPKLTAWVKETNRTAAELSAAAERFPEVDRVVAARSDSPSKLLTKLSHSSDRSTRARVAANTNTPTADYIRLGQQFPKEFLANPVLDLLLLENPGLLSELPAALLTRIAKNESCPETFLVWASNHSEEKVQLAVAMNAKAPTQALDRLHASVFKKVRSSLTPKEEAFEGDPEEAFREAVREWLASLSADDASEAWDKKDIGLAQFKHLSVAARLELAGFGKDYYGHGVNQMSINIAANPKTPAATLSALSNAAYLEVRVAIAANPNTSKATLIALAEDNHGDVRRTIADNPETPVKALKVLALDQYTDSWGDSVRECVAENPNTPVALLEALAKDKDKLVRRGVAENPNTPVPILEVLAKDKEE